MAADMVVYGALVVIALLFWRQYRRKDDGLPLPPGPPSDPVIGHLRVAPTSSHAEVYYEWSRKYGNVLHLSVLGKSLIILNNEEAAVELLDKRSSIYSDRPRFPMQDFIGWTDVLVFLPYGEKFMKQRRLLQQPLVRQAASKFQDTQVVQARTLLHNLLTDPENFEHHTKRFAVAVIMEITYGHRVKSDDDPYIEIAEGINYIATQSGTAGMTPVDVLPFLRHLPAWFPGAWFVRLAEEAKPIIERLRTYPMSEVRKQMAAGTAVPSFLSMHLEELSNRNATEEETSDVNIAAFHMYGAGGDTTLSAIQTFILAMLMHPKVQRKAQAEIDRVVGTSRLPDFDDQDALPYVTATLWESIRWKQGAPLGVPHATTADDIYKGMFIPKGSMVIANVRAISLDENTYADPCKFSPKRFLPKPEGNNEPLPEFAFGYGRRKCPGRYLAENSLWIVAVSLLATFDITKAVDENGREVVPDLEYATGVTSHPKPFKCNIRPRSVKAAELVRNAFHEQEAV